MSTNEPLWLTTWKAGRESTADALSRFDTLSSVDPEELIGQWQGRSLATGHSLDGLLEALGWFGKSVESAQHVHPLLFRSPFGHIVPLEPKLMPTSVALRWPGLARSPMVRLAFSTLNPLLRARKPGASLSRRDFRGRRSTALVYVGQPIVDHLRRVDEQQVVGLMERTDMKQPYFFLLVKYARP